MKTTRILSVMAMGLVLMGVVGSATAELCKKCSGRMYIMSVGQCAECGGHTSSGAHKLCKACSKKLGECEHCRAKLGGGKKVDDTKSGDGKQTDAKKSLAAPGDAIRGKVGDRSLRKLAPDSGAITDAETLKKLLTKWDYENADWSTDFQKNVVVVGTAFGPNIVRLMARKSDDGNLKVLSAASLMAGPGFGWAMKVVSREGVKTVNGKPLPQPGAQGAADFGEMDFSEDGRAVHGLWAYHWMTAWHASAKAGNGVRIGRLLYDGKPVPFPAKGAKPVWQDTPWGMATHSNAMKNKEGWNGWFPSQPTSEQPALLPVPVVLAMGKDINPYKTATHKNGDWAYECTIRARGSRSETRIGKLTFDGKAVDGKQGQWMVTPWGVMRKFSGSYTKGWLTMGTLGGPLGLQRDRQVLSPLARKRAKALKEDLDNLAISVTYRGPYVGKKGWPLSALLHTDDADLSVRGGTQRLKIDPKLAANLIDAMARDGVLDFAMNAQRANIKWPKGPCYMIGVKQTGSGAKASYVWNAGWDLVTLDHIRNLARSASYNEAGAALDKVVGSVGDREKKWTRKATRDAKMELTSPAFEDGKGIPTQYTGEGKDLSPALKWSGVPEGTKELALICEDPDAPRDEPFVHWVIYSIPKAAQGLPAAVPQKEELPEGKLQGVNSFGDGQLGYGGPMPPEGHGPHRYIFSLYALDSKLDLKAGLTRDELLKAIEGHVLGETKLTGIYERK